MLTLTDLSKTFPGVKALSGVSFAVKPAEVHAVCGENGAGKSTLMNILAGHLQPDPGGQIEYDGQPVQIGSVAQARALGIALVHQERSLTDSLSIADNLFANRQPRTRWGLIDYRQLYAQTTYLLARLDVPNLPPQTLVADLSPAQKQLIEIGKALSQQPKLLILDEPTASLTDTETQTLFRLIRELRAAGMSVIYISHRLPEIFAIADTVTVLKDGVHQFTQPTAATTPDALIRAIVGRDLHALERTQYTTGSETLTVENLTGGRFADVSFQVRSGEIVALAGLVGAGRSEVARAIFGIDPRRYGTVHLNGQHLSIHHPADALRAGIGYVPEERKTQGLFLDMSVQDNILSGVFAGDRRPSPAEQAQIAAQYKADLRIQTPSLAQPVRLLSGGNQQKCVLARWLHLSPKLLIVDEPTHGIDVGAKFEIYQLLRQLAAQGTAILLISSELPEVLTLADRVLVMQQGRLAGTLARADASEEAILALAA
jgi:ABC-type sugar transport system ATPase subunit